MMAKLLFLSGFVLLSGCASSQSTLVPPQTLTGQILVVGNEPFTRLAVSVEHEKVYLIQCDESTRQILMSHQGKIAILTYSEIYETKSGEEINVLRATFTAN